MTDTVATRYAGTRVPRVEDNRLLTGRGTSAQWHTQTRTAKSAVLRKLYAAQLYVEINPRDARRLRIEPDAFVRVASRRGSVIARAFITAAVQTGQLFMPMHYALTNHLTHPSFDPYSRQPNYKACAVSLSRATAAAGAKS